MMGLLGDAVKLGRKAAKPAAAGAVATGLLATNAEEAEAGVLGRVLKSDVAYNQLRKFIARNKQKGISPGSSVRDWVHDAANTNYDHMATYARKSVDGHSAGDYYKDQVQSIVDQVLDGVDSPDKDLVAGLEDWSGQRLSREAGYVPKHRQRGAATVPAMGAAAGVGAAGLAAQAAYDPDAPLPLPDGGQILDNVFRILDMPASGLMGITRGLFGLATGEGAEEALRQGVSVSEGGTDAAGERLEDWVADKTGNEDLGWLVKQGLLWGNPF